MYCVFPKKKNQIDFLYCMFSQKTYNYPLFDIKRREKKCKKCKKYTQ